MLKKKKNTDLLLLGLALYFHVQYTRAVVLHEFVFSSGVLSSFVATNLILASQKSEFHYLYSSHLCENDIVFSVTRTKGHLCAKTQRQYDM